jgi:hypothetical protein
MNKEIPELKIIGSTNTTKDLKAIADWHYYEQKENCDYSYLIDMRMIKPNIIESYNHLLKADKRGNIIVPLVKFTTHNQHKYFDIMGYDRKLKVPTENQAKSYINGRKGVAILTPKDIENTENVVIGESYIDCLSYIQLHNLIPEETIIVSTQGTLAETELDTIKAIINKTSTRAKLREIHLAYDNDKMGQKYTTKTKSLIEEIGHNDKIIKKELNYKDWNEKLVSKIKIKQHQQYNQQQMRGQKKKDNGIDF